MMRTKIEGAALVICLLRGRRDFVVRLVDRVFQANC